MEIRFAKENELGRVNELRRQVNDLHVAGRPDLFRPGFSRELQDFLRVIWNDSEKEIVVAEREGAVCGYAVLHLVHRPENPSKLARDFLDVDEFGVDEAFRRQGVATAMIDFIRAFAKEKGLRRIELNMWEFDRDALAFYEAVGFSTYRRYMEMDL